MEAWLGSFGYLALFVVVGAEYMGLPLPGETALVAAALLAARGTLAIGWVWGVAFAASFLGALVGYAIGRRYGLPLALSHGRLLRLDEGRLKIGQYLFARYGFAILFFGRFVALLRTLAAFLAGVNRYPVPPFIAANVLGGLVWTSVFAFGAYGLGAAFERYQRPAAEAAAVVAVLVVVGAGRAVKRLEPTLRANAEVMFPGPLLRPKRRDA